MELQWLFNCARCETTKEENNLCMNLCTMTDSELTVLTNLLINLTIVTK